MIYAVDNEHESMQHPYRVHILSMSTIPNDSCVVVLHHAIDVLEVLHLHSELAVRQRCVTSRPRDLSLSVHAWWIHHLAHSEDWRVATP